MSWNWISRDFGKNFGHPALKRFLLYYLVPLLSVWKIVYMLILVLLYVQEKEAALNLTVDAFCRLVKQHANVAQLVTMYGNLSSLSYLLR